MTNLDSVFKSRDITLSTKVHIVKAMVFPESDVQMWELDHKESWAPKNWCFWTVVLRRLFRVPWTARRSNQSVLNIHWKDWCWSWSSHSLSTWCKELIHWKRPWCWERLRVGGKGGNREWDGWVALPAQWTWIWANSWNSRGQGSLVCCSHGVAKSRTQHSD